MSNRISDGTITSFFFYFSYWKKFWVSVFFFLFFYFFFRWTMKNMFVNNRLPELNQQLSGGGTSKPNLPLTTNRSSDMLDPFCFGVYIDNFFF